MGDQRLYEKIVPVEKGFPIKFARGNGAFPIHWHEYIEMLYYLNDGKVFCNGKSYDMRKGDITIVNSAELHSIIEGEYYCLRISPSFFSDVDTAECYFVNYIPCDTELSDCFEAVFREYNEKGVGYDIEVKSIVYHLIRILLVKYANNKNPKRKNVDMVIDALGFIADNYTDNLTTSDICRHLHVSGNYFSHTFKSTMGYTPTEYINKYRMEKAADLIVCTGMNITDISVAVGIEDSNYFSRLFKRFFNMSPREYKRKMCSDE